MTTTLHIKTDKKLKSEVTKLAASNGLTVTALINISLRQLVNEKRIDLNLAPEVPNPATAKILKRAMKDFKKGKNISPTFSSGKDMDKYLSNYLK